VTSTLITGRTAAGKVFPPHIQFQSKAKTADTVRIDIDVAEHMQQVLRKLGCNKVKTWPITFGTNEKGGMDNKEFAKYIRGFIVPLFPDAVAQPGCRILLKVDSGPRKMNLELLATLKLIGIILYPCVPNMMYMTQETDQLYGLFKTQFLKNLDKIVKARPDKNKSLLLAPKMVGLLLIGGVDQETGIKVEMGAFQKSFVPSRCLAAWQKVGAATKDGITHTCLNNPQVMKKIGDGKETDDETYAAVQMANDLAIFALSNAGYDAHFLQATLQKKEVEESICVLNTAERQERLATALGHGGRFHASNGMHITDNNIFIAFELKDRKKARAEAEKDKKCRQQMQTNKETALAILSDKGASPESYSVKDLDCLFAWHQVKDLPPKAKKEDKLARWRAIVASQKPPPPYKRCRNEDEQWLVALQSDVIGIKDTMFGREVALEKRELEAAAGHFTWEEREATQRKLDAINAAKSATSKEAMQSSADPLPFGLGEWQGIAQNN
jgi:hypothetical protein